MYRTICDTVVVGGGPAGLAAAAAARREGAGRVLIVERDSALGGILQQCIHPGFGLAYFNEELTGPEYAGRFMAEAESLGVEALLNTMVLDVFPEQRKIAAVSSARGLTEISFGSLVLAMGCRERTRGNIMIPGTRPAGVYTAGTAQRMINRQNERPGDRIVILGSGDIGMIMARRLTLEGARVEAVVEIADFLAGLTRNRVQCLDDFGIPLYMSHTVTKITGNRRVEGVWIAEVDKQRRPIKGTERLIPCDTLLLSVGLIPENELSRGAGIELSPVTGGPSVDQHMQTSAAGVFAAGNVVHVNDLVDNVSFESENAGRNAALYALGKLPEPVRTVHVSAGDGVRYVCPHRLSLGEEERVRLYFRVSRPAKGVRIRAVSGGRVLAERKAFSVNPGEMERLDVTVSAETCPDLTVQIAEA